MLSSYTHSLMEEMKPYRTNGRGRTAKWGDSEASPPSHWKFMWFFCYPTFLHYIVADTCIYSSLFIYSCVQPTSADKQRRNYSQPYVRIQDQYNKGHSTVLTFEERTLICWNLTNKSVIEAKCILLRFSRQRGRSFFFYSLEYFTGTNVIEALTNFTSD